MIILVFLFFLAVLFGGLAYVGVKKGNDLLYTYSFILGLSSFVFFVAFSISALTMDKTASKFAKEYEIVKLKIEDRHFTEQDFRLQYDTMKDVFFIDKEIKKNRERCDSPWYGKIFYSKDIAEFDYLEPILENNIKKYSLKWDNYLN